MRTGPSPAAAATIVLLCVLARAAAAEDFAVVLDYDVRFGPLTLVTMELTTEAVAERYRTRMVLETTGLIGRLFPWRAHSESQGRREHDGLYPERHRAAGTYRSTHRMVEIDYAPDGSVRSRVSPPPEEDSRDPVPDSLQQATIDPLTASLSAMAGGCRGRLAVFDGRRRYDLVLEELAAGEVPSRRRGMYAGPARHCRAIIEPQAGFWHGAPGDSDAPARLEFWIASPAAGLPPAPVHLQLSGARGTLDVVLRQARALDAGPTASGVPPS